MKAILFLIVLTLSISSVLALDLNVNKPENGGFYSSTTVAFDLSSNVPTYFFYKDLNDTGLWKRLCSTKRQNCLANGRLHNGFNILLIKADDLMGNQNETQINVTVDNKKPRVLKTSPKGQYTNGSSFYVNYTEDDLMLIKLYYGSGSTIRNITNVCNSGENQMCSFSPNLSEFEGRTIEFWYSLQDKANMVNSSKNRIKVDVTPPNITDFFNESAGNRRFKFVFDILEENFNKVIFKDENTCGPIITPSGTLCSSLRNGQFVATKTFCVGSHNIEFTVLDKVGNSAMRSTSFEIVV